MGDLALIDSYLDAFRRSVIWRPDSEEVVAEVTDHLLVAVERELAGGSDLAAAQRNSLERFGEPTVVSRAFASTYSGGVALPTQLTKRSGLLGMIGAGSLLLLLAAMLMQSIPLLERNGLQPDEYAPWPIWSIVAVVGFGGIAALTVGIKRRHGSALGSVTRLSIALSVVATILMVAPWMILLAAPLVGIGSLLVGLPMLREGIAPRWATVLFSVGALVATAAAGTLYLTEIGTVDYWGDPVVPPIVGFATLAVFYVPGVYGLGRWLLQEVPVDDSETPLIAG